MQHRTGLHRRFGKLGLDDLREPSDEVAGHLDTHLDPVAVPDRRQGPLDTPAEVQRDTVSGLGGVQGSRTGVETSIQQVEFAAQRLGEELLVETRSDHAALPIRMPRTPST